MAGEILKEKREHLGIPVEEAASALKIRKDYLSFIENDTFEKLPVPVYTAGYIRAYAKYLDVDPEPIVEFYKQHLSQPESAAIMPIAFSRKKGPGIYVVVTLLTVVAAGVVFFFFFRQRPAPTGVPQMPPAVQQQAQQQPRQEAQQEVQQQAGPVGAPQTVVTPPEQPKEPTGHNLKITATETTWLAIRLEDGKKDEVLLRPGDSKDWTFPGKATLKIGNAGGVDIHFDGEDLGIPGDPGQVMELTLPEEPENGTTSP